jgi:3,2-trans-enoyl-CoA isomerase
MMRAAFCSAAPPWMGQLMVRTIGFRPAERALALGTLFPPSEALEAGVVDDVITEESSSESHEVLQALLPEALQSQTSNPVMIKAYEEAACYAKIPPQARVASKLVTRSESLKEMQMTREGDTQHFCGFITHEMVQKNLLVYVEKMKQRGKTKKK